MDSETHEGQKTTTKVEIQTTPAPPPAPRGTMEQTITITQTDTPLKQFGRWFGALYAAVVKGGTHAILGGTSIQIFKVYNPNDLEDALRLYGSIFATSAMWSAFLFWNRNPLPMEWSSEYEGTEMDRRADRKKETDK